MEYYSENEYDSDEYESDEHQPKLNIKFTSDVFLEPYLINDNYDDRRLRISGYLKQTRAPLPIISYNSPKHKKVEDVPIEKKEEDVQLVLNWKNFKHQQTFEKLELFPAPVVVPIVTVHVPVPPTPVIVTPTSLKQTQMCKSTLSRRKCNYKECNYAHSLKELVVNSCRFKDRCNFVIKNNRLYKNKDAKRVCNYIHPHEEMNDYYIRVGLGSFFKKN